MKFFAEKIDNSPCLVQSIMNAWLKCYQKKYFIIILTVFILGDSIRANGQRTQIVTLQRYLWCDVVYTVGFPGIRVNEDMTSNFPEKKWIILTVI